MKGIISLSKVKKTGRSTKKKNRDKLMDTVHDNYSKYLLNLSNNISFSGLHTLEIRYEYSDSV